jgi:hypothetical protein
VTILLRIFAACAHFSVFGRIFSEKYLQNDLGAFFSKNRPNLPKQGLYFGYFFPFKFPNFEQQFLQAKIHT